MTPTTTVFNESKELEECLLPVSMGVEFVHCAKYVSSWELE